MRAYLMPRECLALFIRRMDAVAAVYHLAASLSPATDRLRSHAEFHRRGRFDATITLHDGRSFGVVRQSLAADGVTWVSTYDIRPAKLFDGIDQRLCISLTSAGKGSGSVYSSRYHRWHETCRLALLQTVEYVDTKLVLFPNSVPKAHCAIETELLD